MQTISLGNPFINLKGEWKEDEDYEYLDAVTNRGSLFIANKKFVPAGTLPEENEAWMLIAKGVDEGKDTEQIKKILSEHTEVSLKEGAHGLPCGGAEGQVLTVKDNELTWGRVRHPITKDTTWYVRTDGDDANDGSEDTPEKAFKTISYALNYVADNYNLGSHNVTIYVSAGIYEEVLVLPQYTSTSGSISIVGEDKQTTRISVKDTNSITSITSAGLFSIQGFGLDVISTNTEKTLFPSWVTASHGVTINISDVDCTYVAMADTKSSFYGLTSLPGGVLDIQNGVKATITRKRDKGTQSFFTAFGDIKRSGTSSEGDITYLYGECTQIIYAQGGSFFRNKTHGKALFFGNVIGKKYTITSGGKVDTVNAGGEYFPGSLEGTIESSTYSWYK